MKEHLERLVQTVKDTQLVERLMAASSLEERVAICKEAKETPQFKEFMEHYNKAIADLDLETGSVFYGTNFICTEDNAVEIALILIIESIDDCYMFDGIAMWKFMETLDEVKGTQERIAKNIIDFFLANRITDCSLEQILERVF